MDPIFGSVIYDDRNWSECKYLESELEGDLEKLDKKTKKDKSEPSLTNLSTS